MHKLLALANALVGQNRPGEDRTTGARRRRSGREVRRVHAGARHAGDLSSTTTGCTEPDVAVAVGHRTPVTEPQRHSPRSATGGAGGRAAGEAMPLPRQRSVVGRWTGAQVGGSTRRAPPCTSFSCWPTPWSDRTAPGRPDTGAQRRGSGREVRRPPPRELSSPRRRAPYWRSRRPPRAVRNRMSPSPSGTGHRSLNPNVTSPGLRPGAREGEPQASRCRSRVSVPSSAVERGPGPSLATTS